MKKIIVAAFLFFLFSLTMIAQGLKVQIDNFPSDRVYIFAYKGDDMLLIDSVSVISGELLYIFDESADPGLYHLYLENPAAVSLYDKEIAGFDFIYDNENIDIHTNFLNLRSQFEVRQSVSNQIYVRYLLINQLYREKLGHLLELLPLYDKEGSFYNALAEEIIDIQESYNDSLVILSSAGKGNFVSGLILFMKEPVYNPYEEAGLKEFMQDHFLEPVNFNNSTLLNSPVITQKILSYLSFFRTGNTGQEEQELSFIKAIDRIMKEISYDQDVYDFVLNYLIDGFERFQMDRVLIHIADNYLAGECETDNERIMQERLEAYRLMTIGQKQSDISLIDPEGSICRMSDTESEYILLIFWATWCPHCSKLLPRISEWYREEGNQMNLSLYTVSIDTSMADWEEFVLLNDMAGKNVIDAEGWEGKIARKYNLYATPTMFVLDRQLKIIAKPLTIREIKKSLQAD